MWIALQLSHAVSGSMLPILGLDGSPIYVSFHMVFTLAWCALQQHPRDRCRQQAAYCSHDMATRGASLEHDEAH